MAIDSPFKDTMGKDTTPKGSTMPTTTGPSPGPASDYGDFPVALAPSIPGSASAMESPFDEVIVTKINTVTSFDPGGSAPMESPFTDKLAK